MPGCSAHAQAGLVLGVASVEDNDLEDTLTMLNTNVTAVIMLTKLFVSGMLERNRGHIINISSIAGQETYGVSGL
jgi:3-hydroxy acid dehydrogenase/malonic semialdehyde reductase